MTWYCFCFTTFWSLYLYFFLSRQTKSMSSVDSKALAVSMRDLAVNPQCQGMFAEQPDLINNLMNFTTTSQDKDNETLLICMEALFALSKHKECRAKLNNVDGIMVKLAALCDYSNGVETDRINLFAKNTMDHLAGTAPVLSVGPNRFPQKTSAFGTRGGYLSNVVISLPELTADGRDKVESALVNTKGVVSFTIDVQRKTATLYCSQNSKEIQPKIMETLCLAGWKAEPVTALADKNAATTTKSTKPGYIKKSTNTQDALVRYNDKKKDTKKEDASGGFFNSVTSYFW